MPEGVELGDVKPEAAIAMHQGFAVFRRRPRHRHERRSAMPGGLRPMSTCGDCTAKAGPIASWPSNSALGA
jgi:hypothetical protein